MHTVSEGDGPVNALDAALRKALARVYPRLAEMHLVDYKVRVVNSPGGNGGPSARGDRMARRQRRLGDRRRQREHHRGELAGVGRQRGI